MFQRQTQWEIECKSCQNVVCRHKDNADCEMTVYRPPIFQIFINYQQQQASIEEKHIMEKLEEEYVYGIPSLLQSLR